MKFLFKIGLVFSLLFSPILCKAQFEIKGKVLDSSSQPLYSASIVLLHSTDSTVHTYSLSDQEGAFTLKVKDSSNFLIQFSFLGYETVLKPLAIKWSGKQINLGPTQLQKAEVALDEVTIEAERIAVQMKGDTLIYDPKAFKTKDGDDVEALLKLLPGIEIDKDGNLIAQGKKVEKVLVDGKEFFGNDLKIATKNLDAETIKKVEVLDKKSREAEFTGVDDGKEEKTINLSLKEEYKKGQFGRAEIAAGTQETYRAKANYNKFNETTKASVIGSTNNLNERNSSFGGADNINRRAGRNNVEGINSTYTAGSNLNHEFNQKHEINLNYFYSQTDNEVNRIVRTQSFTLNDEFETEDNSTASSSDKRHALRGSYHWKIDSLSELSIQGNLSIASSFNSNISSTIYTPATANGDLVESRSENENDRLNTDQRISYRRKSRKKGRSFISNYSYYQTNGEQLTDLETNTFGDRINQIQDFEEKQQRHRLNSVLTLPIKENWYLKLKHLFSHETDQPSRQFFDRNNEILLLNDSLSGNFQRDVDEHSGELQLRKNGEKVNFSVGARFATIGIQAAELDRNFNFIYPSATLLYRLKKSENIRFGYSTNSRNPTLNQLISIPTNTNPNNNYVGNSNLKPEFQHRLNLNYYKFDFNSSLSYYLGLTFSTISNKMLNQTVVNDDFTSFSSPVNTDFYRTLAAYANVNGKIKSLNLSYRLSPKYNFNHSEVFLNGSSNRVKRATIGSTAELGRDRSEKWDVTIGANFSSTQTEYEVNSEFNQRFANLSWYAKGELELSKALVLTVNYSIQSFNAVSFSDARILHFVNASLQQSLKGGKWLIYLTGTDILNQNIGLRRNNGLNNLREENYNTRTQFFMLGISRKFGQRRKRSGITK